MRFTMILVAALCLAAGAPAALSAPPRPGSDPGAAALAQAEDAPVDHRELIDSPDLLRWEVLTKTVYDPRKPVVWPEAVAAANGLRVRMEGFLMPRYGSQDPEDLFLTGINPTNLLCGPSDITQVVELHIPGFKADAWPRLPVEIIGTFHLSARTENYRPIYLFLGESWRELRRWEQPFPGVQDPDGFEDPDDLTR